MLEKLFHIRAQGSSVRTEVLAGCTTFLTMSAILFINPDILSAAGMDHGAVFVATCLAGAIGSLLMGVLANYPIGQGPGMGINAFFAFGLVKGMGLSWEAALGAVFLSGILIYSGESTQNTQLVGQCHSSLSKTRDLRWSGAVYFTACPATSGYCHPQPRYPAYLGTCGQSSHPACNRWICQHCHSG